MAIFKNTLTIDPIQLNNSGLYSCFGFDASLKRYFVATGEVIPIGKLYVFFDK